MDSKNSTQEISSELYDPNLMNPATACEKIFKFFESYSFSIFLLMFIMYSIGYKFMKFLLFLFFINLNFYFFLCRYWMWLLAASDYFYWNVNSTWNNV